MCINYEKGGLNNDDERFQKSSPLKLLFQINRNYIGSIHGWSSIKITHFVLIQFLKIFSSETTLPN